MWILSLEVSIVMDKEMFLRFFVFEPALTIAHPTFTQDLKPSE